MLSRAKAGLKIFLIRLYMEPEVIAWAQEGMVDENREPTRDSNGTRTVLLSKFLKKS